MNPAKSNIVRFERSPYSGTFTVRDAALYLRATTPPEHVSFHKWARQHRPQKFAASTRSLYSWIRLGQEWHAPFRVGPSDRVVTFEDMVRLRLIALLRSRGVPYAKIRSAEQFIRSQFGIAQPFVTEQFWLAGPILFEFENYLIGASPGAEWQTAFTELRPFFEPIEHGLSFDQSGIADLWRPAQEVLIDPEIQFGAPCIEGTRIETEVLWAFHQAGDSEESIARMYGLDLDRVRAAIAWEERLAATMAA